MFTEKEERREKRRESVLRKRFKIITNQRGM